MHEIRTLRIEIAGFIRLITFIGGGVDGALIEACFSLFDKASAAGRSLKYSCNLLPACKVDVFIGHLIPCIHCKVVVLSI